MDARIVKPAGWITAVPNHKEGYEDVGRIKLGDYFALDVLRRDVRGFQTAPELYFWNAWLAR